MSIIFPNESLISKSLLFSGAPRKDRPFLWDILYGKSCLQLNAMADYKRDLPWEDFRQSMIDSGRVNMEY